MKKFYTYEEQIEHLKKKGLVIADEEAAISALKRYSYYAGVSAYKDIFKIGPNDNYIPGTEFTHIVVLYMLDQSLRDMFLHQIVGIERHMKSLYSYTFCSLYGDRQKGYLNANNYNYAQHQNQVNEYLVMVLDQLRKPKHEYISYNLSKYGEVPFWVLIHALTFGNISKMYSFSQPKLQSQIARQFGGPVNPKTLASMLQVLTKFRNICAHGERVYAFKPRMTIDDMPIHAELKIPKRGTVYMYGKQDLFAVVIALHYLLPKEEFKSFVIGLDAILTAHFSTLPSKTASKIQKRMGFPENWKDILEC